MAQFWYKGLIHSSPPDDSVTPFAVIAENRTTPMIPVESSAIKGIGYRWPRTHRTNAHAVVMVLFHGGRLYEYSRVTLTAALGLLDRSTSLGEYYNLEIKGQFPSRRID